MTLIIITIIKEISNTCPAGVSAS
ncbi:uncharacterized protein METZ01_LOCUS4528 [marine metagenome]|uniref:Uncharacterized protein n=1 Tax=marine metagenome TaxID=408172 RepID=A0A381NC76_9ZZZZ